MESRTLGRSGLDVGSLGMGCWAIGGPFRDGDGWMGYGPVADATSRATLRRALELGIRLFDVSDVYGCGHAERLLGEVVGDREGVVVASKFGYTFDEESRTVTGRITRPEQVRAACEASLQRLRRERIDLYQLHLYDLEPTRALDLRAALEDLVDAGKIGWYAWCTEDLARLEPWLDGARRCTAVPQQLHLFRRDPALLAWCERLDLACLARRPLGMGLLTGKHRPDHHFPPEDMRRRFGWNLRDGRQAETLRRLRALAPALCSDGRSLAQAALGWIWAQSPLAIPIPGCKTPAQLEENAAARDFGPLPEEVLAAVEVAKEG